MTSAQTVNIRELFKLDPTIEAFNKEAYSSVGGLISDVWHDKYLQRGEKIPADAYKRVAKAIASAPCETDPDSAEQLFFEVMNQRLFLPGGRILAGAGTSKVVTLMNCLGGETELYTKEFGIKSLQELTGKTVTVLTRGGWKSAEIKCFGIQRLNRIELAPSRSKNRRKIVRATADHRWFLKGGMELTKLYKGAKLETCSDFVSGKRDEYRAGLFHGIIFGDGQLHRQTLREVSGGYPLGTYHHVLRACGRVTEHYDLLDEYCTNYKQPDAAKGDRIYYHHGSENYKDFPIDKSADYISGFIDGWWIADGHYENNQTQRCISSTNYEHLDWLVKYAPLGGYIVTGDKIIGKKVTNLGVAKDPCRAVTILPEEKTGGWEVISIQEDSVEPVYCAVVDDVHAFCLTEGLYTGNCYVNETLEDSMVGIMSGVSNLALTSQQGGGMGTAFETLRPKNAILTRTQSAASGVLPFMDVFSQTGKTIRSAGERRAAQMGTISDTHPDLPEYIVAKGLGLEDGSKRLSEFNISVLISDAFLAACEDDAEWLLYFHIPPTNREEGLKQYDFDDDSGTTQFVYAVWRARDLWDLILANTYKYSDPGVIFIDRVNDLNNLSYVETIRCTNPCVTGDTMILTKLGHRPIKSLVGNEVDVWNGFEWSSTTPFSTGINKLIEVKFSNGQTVRCTPEHKWHLKRGVYKTSELGIGDELIYVEMPTVTSESGEFAIDAYSQGMYCGDGTKNSEYSNLYKHNEGILNRLVGKIYNRNCESQPGHRWIHGPMLPKDFVPVSGSIEYCINWLAGYLDADGSVLKKTTTKVIEASAKDREFLQRIGLMLNRLGVNYRIWERKDAGLKTGSNGKEYTCESTAALMIAHKGANQLVQLGLKCERLNLDSFQKAPKGIARVGHKVVSVKHLQHTEETFCMNEPLRNSFVANGVITHNCGEQPLPPNGTCNLGAINVAQCVKFPFTENAELDIGLLEAATTVGVRFLDNVIEVTGYPLEAQKAEEYAKRRIGLGITGLGTCLAQLRQRYGSVDSERTAAQIMKTIALAAYRASIDLAKTRGAFPLFDQVIVEKGFIAERMPDDIIEGILEHGLRNGVLLTIAPVGTGSIALGNISSGLEPDFSHAYERNVRSKNTEEFTKYTEKSYTLRFLEYVNTVNNDPRVPRTDVSWMTTALDLDILDHIKIQGACQKWVDASVSKTINIPEDYPFEKFAEVYQLAHQYGCKGCTTYRPSNLRQSILSVPAGEPQVTVAEARKKRGEELSGTTYKIKWPSLSSSLFVTINYLDDSPYEIFFASKDAKFQDWMTSLTLLASALLRNNVDPAVVPRELRQVKSTYDTGWHQGKLYGSLVARIAKTIEDDFIKHGIIPPKEPTVKESDGLTLSSAPSREENNAKPLGELCSSCQEPHLVHKEGCKTCNNCGWSECG